MKYSENVPTVAGHYWELHPDGHERIIEYPHCGQWPISWEERRNEMIENTDEAVKKEIASLPKERWVVKWAGPIERPNS